MTDKKILALFNKLLAMSKEECNKVIKTLSKPVQKSIFDSIPTLTDLLRLDQVEDHEDRILLRYEYIQKHPDQVFWDYPEYALYTKRIKTLHAMEDGLIQCRSTKISTNGEMIQYEIKDNRLEILSLSTLANKNETYNKCTINTRKCVLHRAIASTFIPKPGRHKELLLGELEVNHMDRNTKNNNIINLEWLTCIENILHRHGREDYKDDRYYKFTMIGENHHKNKEFIIHEDFLNYFNTERSILTGYNKVNEILGMRITPLTKKEVEGKEIGFNEEILNDFFENKVIFLSKNNPVIGTVEVGEHKGLTFSIYSVTESHGSFYQQSINNAIKNNTLHGGCKFRLPTSLEEMGKYYNKFTENVAKNIKEFIENSRTVILATFVEDPYKGKKHVFNNNTELSKFFTITQVYRVLAGKTTSDVYNGCTFERIPLKDVNLYQDKFTKEMFETLNPYKPVLGTVIKGAHKGLKFSFLSKEEEENYFPSQGIYKTLKGDTKSHYSCIFENCTLEEAQLYHNKMTQEIFKTLDGNKTFTPIIVTILKGPHKGLKQTFLSLREIREYFTMSKVYDVLSEKATQHKGCTFQYISSEETELYRDNFTHDIMKTINAPFKPLLGTVVQGPHKGLKFGILSHDDMDDLFDITYINMVLEEKNKTHNGCTFKHCTYKEAELYQGNITPEILESVNDNAIVIGTVLKGPHKGLQFSFFSLTELKTHFHYGNVWSVLKGKRTQAQNCSFRYGTSEEAEPYRGKMTIEIASTLEMFTAILGTVIKGHYEGLQFSFSSIEEMEEYFSKKDIRLILKGKNVFDFYKFIDCSEEEALPYRNKMTPEIFETLKDGFRPILGTVLEGPYKGLQFSFLSRKELIKYFKYDGIGKVINGALKTYKNCTFKVCTIEEALEHKGKMSLEIFKTINGEFTPVLGIIECGRFQGMKFFFPTKEDLFKYFDWKYVRETLMGKIKSHNGCRFEYSNLEEGLVFYKNMTPEIFDTLPNNEA